MNAFPQSMGAAIVNSPELFSVTAPSWGVVRVLFKFMILPVRLIPPAVVVTDPLTVMVPVAELIVKGPA